MQIIESSEFLADKKTVVVAISGGADSVCLTHYFWELAKYPIILAHFNHHVRNEESDQDEKLVTKLAEKLELPLEIGHWKTPQKSEAGAREARYKFLRKIQKKHNAQAICLGHHQDDQIETILFNFIRGTGLKGLQGMPLFENQLFRPLLNCAKKEILDYCKKHKLEYSVDHTNFDINYSRNLLRLKIIPELEKINPSLGKTLLQNSQNYQKIHKHLQNQMQPFLGKNKIKIKDFLELDEAVQTELIKEKIKNHTEASFKKVEEILRIIHGGRGNKFKKFGGIKVSIRKGEIVFDS